MSSPDKVFEALASTTRRRILAYLSEGPLTAGVIAERFDMSQPGHLQAPFDSGDGRPNLEKTRRSVREIWHEGR